MNRHYLLGGNTPKGFFSYYPYLLDQKKANKIYVIKGGPGTGKSTTMKMVAKWGEDKGYDVDYIHCSSDPDSLDGVLIHGLNIAMVDGTSPHVVDPQNPGCVDHIVNMGDFWDESGLRGKKDEVIRLNSDIKGKYACAYHYLRAAGALYENILELSEACTTQSTINDIADSILQKETTLFSVNGSGSVRKLFLSAIGPQGVTSYSDTFKYEKTYLLKAETSTAGNALLQRITEGLLAKHYDVECFFDPLCPASRIEHLCVPELNLAILSNNYYNMALAPNPTVIDLDSMIKDEIYNVDFCYNKIMVDNLIKKASAVIARAKAQHDLLEQCYIPYMDFDKISELRQALLSEIAELGENV